MPEEYSSEGITISDELTDVHGIVTKVIDDNTVILKLQNQALIKATKIIALRLNMLEERKPTALHIYLK